MYLPLLSPSEAERWLGLPPSRGGRRFLRLALAQERRVGVAFVHRWGEGTGRRYGVTRTALRRYMPELFTDTRRTDGRVERVLARLRRMAAR